jgi:hypothetical protein
VKAAFFSLLILTLLCLNQAAAGPVLDGRKLDETLAATAKAIVPAISPASLPRFPTIRVTRKGSFSPRLDRGSCSTKNFAERLGEPRNQDGLNWCFGSVAADVLSMEVGRRISDFDLSLRTFAVGGSQLAKLGKNDSLSKLSAASISKAIGVGLADGICLEENLPANDRVLGMLAAEMEKNGYKLTAEELEETAATLLVKAIQSMESVRGWNLQRLIANESSTCDAVNYASAMFPALDTSQIVNTFSGAPNNEAIFRWLVSLSCQRQPISLLKGINFKHLVPPKNIPEGSRGFHLLTSLDRRLDKEKPVVFGYRAKKFFVDEPEDVHASIIVGREFRDGVCKYLVRNSYGSGCGQYKEPYAEPTNCTRGHFWITEEDFQKSAEFIEFFE